MVKMSMGAGLRRIGLMSVSEINTFFGAGVAVDPIVPIRYATD
jgi:hypothetical protein